MPILKSYVIRDRTLLASNKKPHTKEEFTVLTWKCKCGVDFRTTGSRNLGEALGFCLSVHLSLSLSSSFSLFFFLPSSFPSLSPSFFHFFSLWAEFRLSPGDRQIETVPSHSICSMKDHCFSSPAPNYAHTARRKL